MRACLASGGYNGVTLRMRLACCTLPPTRMRCGVVGLTSLTGGGGGAAVGIPPSTPPSTPPGAPPGTPPTTPPTTPELDGGGNSSSLILAISLGMVLGAISLPAAGAEEGAAGAGAPLRNWLGAHGAVCPYKSAGSE